MIAHVDNRITYNGNGNATEFAYQFKILDRTDIKVLLTDADGKEKLLTKDYYVDVEKNVVRYPGYAVGAEVPESERPPVLPTGWKLTIYREVPVTQETDLPDQYPFNQVEAIGDKLTMIAQQLTDVTSRSLKISVSKSADIDTAIPWENGKSFRISDDGKTLELSEDPAKVLPLAQGVYAQAQAQAQSAYASAAAAAKSEDSAAASASEVGNSAQSASTSAAGAAESARLAEGYKNVAETAKSDASLYADNAKTSADNATASKEAAQSAANSASNFATDARSSANEAKSYRDAASTYATNAKNYSENVNVFVPSVSAEGVLSWSNKAGLTNPPSVNIKGKDGADGGVTVDAALSDSSTNPVQNKVINEALNNRAVLDDTNTFTSPNRFDDIYMQNGINSLKWYDGSPNFVVGYINSKTYTGNAATATKATKDSAGNVITETYAKKTDISGVVKSVNGVQPDANGNVNITVSGGGSGVTVDEELSSTSTNPVQNKTIYNALLNKAGTDIFSGFDLNSPSATIRWRNGSQNYGILTASNYSGTALRATQDGAGNIITETYAKKTDISNATVDATLSATSTNAIANKAVYSALNDKLGKTDTAYAATKATQDGNGNVISSTYIKSVNNVTPDENGNVNITVSGGGSNITVDAELSATSTNPVQNKVIKGALDDKADLNKNNTFSKENYFQKGMSLIAYRDLDSAIKWYQSTANPPIASIDATNYTGTAAKATSDSAGNIITETYAKKTDVSGVVKSVNGTKPDASGNVTVAVSGGGVSTSESNTWTAQQNFRDLMLNREKYTTYVVNGTSDTPVTSTMVYAVTGAFTLNLATLAGALSASQSSVFTAYFAANADYSLTISNAGKLKYTGSASDVAITTSGLLLNIWMSKDGGGTLTSIVQATKLS